MLNVKDGFKLGFGFALGVSVAKAVAEVGGNLLYHSIATYWKATNLSSYMEVKKQAEELKSEKEIINSKVSKQKYKKVS